MFKSTIITIALAGFIGSAVQAHNAEIDTYMKKITNEKSIQKAIKKLREITKPKGFDAHSLNFGVAGACALYGTISAISACLNENSEHGCYAIIFSTIFLYAMANFSQAGAANRKIQKVERLISEIKI